MRTPWRRARPWLAGGGFLLAALSGGCTRRLELIRGPDAAVAATTGPWASMIYAARTDSGVIVIDLGWVGARKRLVRLLASINARPADVRWVFLTHAHRDHIAAWPLVRPAHFVLGAREAPFLTGSRDYQGFATRLADRLVPYPRPAPGELLLLAVQADTAIALGRDSVFTFAVPGHTAGSTAFLFRGILFGGDAINWRPFTGFQGARPEFSDDAARSRTSMRALWARLDASRVRVACTAHAKCGVVDAAFRAATSR